MDVTVAIPTYNGALRLPDVFQKLQTQVKTDAIGWVPPVRLEWTTRNRLD